MRKFLELAKLTSNKSNIVEGLNLNLRQHLTCSSSLANQASSGKGAKSGDQQSGRSATSAFGSPGKQRSMTSKGRNSKPGIGSTGVQNDERNHRFILDLGNNQSARIDYKTIGPQKLELYHTEVPKELRGRGIGRALSKGAFEHAMRQKLKLKLTCSYLVDYANRFADSSERDILLSDKDDSPKGRRK